jgi:excisionase family DNA binding protein
MEAYLSPADAARILRVTTATVRKMEARGVLKLAGKTEGGIRLFRRHDVEALAKERREEQRHGR